MNRPTAPDGWMSHLLTHSPVWLRRLAGAEVRVPV